MKKLGIALASIGFAGFIGFSVYREYKGIPLDADDIVGDFTGDGKEDALHWGMFINRGYLNFLDGEFLTKTQDGEYLRHGFGVAGLGLGGIERGKYDFSVRDANRDGNLDLIGYPADLRSDVFLYNSAQDIWLGDGKDGFSKLKVQGNR